MNNCAIVLYADDIMLLSSSVTYLERMLHACERELACLDMSINLSKSCCLQVGPRCDVNCTSVTSLSGHCLPWVAEMRYLGIYIVCFKSMKCSLDECKKKFYCAANGIFGKIGRTASEDVILTLYRTVMPIGTPFFKEKNNSESMIKIPNMYIFGKLRI